jgi:hypothetical protein
LEEPVDLTLQVSLDTREALKFAAQDRQMTRSELVRRILDGWLKGEEV